MEAQLPFLTGETSPSVSGGSPKNSGAAAPPREFEGVRAVRWSRRAPPPPMSASPLRGSNSAHTAAQKAGLRYEEKVHALLEHKFGSCFALGPWFEFCDHVGVRRCQPDGLVFCDNGIVICEMKTYAVGKAWYQLRQLYEPVVRKAFPAKPISLLLVPKVHDPQIQFPEAPVLLDTFPTRVVDGQFGVLPWTLLSL